MPDNDTLSKVPEAKTVPKKRTHLSFVWIIPLIAAAAGIWIAVTKILGQGPRITIVFSSADGLQANKTKIDYNGLEVGTLTSIKLSSDHKHVIATAEMSPKAKDFLVKDTQFWVVKPRVTGLNVTGLSTLISGYYIGVQLGQSKESERHFTALESPPLTGDVPGRIFMLKTTELGSLGEGTPIFFRQLQAGQVVSYELDKSGEFLNVKIFVQSPYDEYVTPDTRFWHASGVDVSLTAAGLRVQTESVMSILAGGIAFETPATDSPLPPADAGITFNLFDDRTDAFKPPVNDPHTYLLVFKQSVRGLTVGAPVELGGIPIGQVTQINPQFDAKTMEFTVPITVTVDPERYGVKFINAPTNQNPLATHKQVIETLVSHGLRAQLKTGNLLSGSLFVAMDFTPDAPPVTLDWSQTPVQLPTKSGQLDAVEDSVADLLKNLNKTMTNLDATVAGARGTLTNADNLLNSANQLIEPNSVLDSELNNMLMQGGDAARSLRVLMDYLERHPEALIRGKTGEAK
ncbi:MAG TPA: MlaD family protein [Verrucomicrobiae bacterium]|jgi:paraquat-inducible protein B|nr:MlaD family protein [Verrucomicrobiae bacterium]